jgi:hypothetical protein
MFDLIFQERDGLSRPQSETRNHRRGGQQVTLRQLIVERARAQYAGEKPAGRVLSVAARLDPASP